MMKTEINRQLDDIILRMHSEPQRIGLLNKIAQKSDAVPVDSQIENAIGYLSICVSYLLFDAEVLRRQVEYLKNRNGDQSGDK